MQIRPYHCTCKMYIFAQSEKLTSSFKTLVMEKSKKKKKICQLLKIHTTTSILSSQWCQGGIISVFTISICLKLNDSEELCCLNFLNAYITKHKMSSNSLAKKRCVRQTEHSKCFSSFENNLSLVIFWISFFVICTSEQVNTLKMCLLIS